MIIVEYNESHLPLVEKLLRINQGIFEGWKTVPDLTAFQTYVVEGHGIVAGEALGPGNYLWSSAFLPESKGIIAGKAQMLMMDKAFTETDMVTAWGVADMANPEGVANLKQFNNYGYEIPIGRKLNSINYLEWASKSKSLEREALKYWEKMNVFPPHWVFLYAFLKTCHLGWPIKALQQWYIYERVATSVPYLKSINSDYTQFFYDGMVFEWEKGW